MPPAMFGVILQELRPVDRGDDVVKYESLLDHLLLSVKGHADAPRDRLLANAAQEIHGQTGPSRAGSDLKASAEQDAPAIR